jgi:tetratricopeptide (TPR) repeat protein
MSGKGLAFWPLFSLLMGQVSLSAGIKTTDLRPPNLSTLKTNNASSEEELSKAKVLIEKGEFQKALPILEHLLKKAPDDPAALFYLGYTRENLRDTAGAISAYEAFLKKNPQPEVYFRVGLLALGRGKLPEATIAFQRAAEARPDWADAQLLAAYALFSANKPHEALPYAQKAISLDNTETPPLLLGDIYFAVDSFVQTRAAYEEALRRNPTSPAAHLGLGKSLLALLKPDEALPHLQKAADQLPNSIHAHYYLALSYKSLSKPTEAKAGFRKALSIDSTHARSHYELALLYLQEKKSAEAETHYNALLKYNPRLAQRLAPLLGK